jgi:hypothetical protein
VLVESAIDKTSKASHPATLRLEPFPPNLFPLSALVAENLALTARLF